MKDISDSKQTKKYVVYKITSISNNKIYIGITNNYLRRISEHTHELNNNRHNNRYMLHSWKKYGQDTFTIEIVEQTNSKTDALTLETDYIIKTKSYDLEHGFNLTYGGEGVWQNEETRERTSESNKRTRRDPAWKRNHLNEYKNGTKNANRALTYEQASDIKHKYADGYSIKEVQSLYPEIDYGVLKNIALLRTYAAIEPQLNEKISSFKGERRRKEIRKRTDKEIIEIKQRLISGEKVSEIARSMNIPYAAVSEIKNKKIKAHYNVGQQYNKILYGED